MQRTTMGKPTTFGVVSLVGDKQALKIDSILRQRVEPAEYRRRQLLCGDSAQFQGDERDVMFLSVVDSPPEQPPLSMRQEGPKKIFKKRFNVAASRARNQMWIVHSLNHETDLQAGDYRRRLIEHALDPEAWERELQKRLAKVDPRSKVFEGTVLRRLMERGYNVFPQHQVGAYYIDLVVVGNGRRLAIECDGEQFHGPEKLQEDLEREAILVRRGWTFERIRGSLFFRDEDRALEPVFRRLEELGITPELIPSRLQQCPNMTRLLIASFVGHKSSGICGIQNKRTVINLSRYILISGACTWPLEVSSPRIAEILTMKAEQAARRRLDDLFQSMLHQVFNGEL